MNIHQLRHLKQQLRTLTPNNPLNDIVVYEIFEALQLEYGENLTAHPETKVFILPGEEEGHAPRLFIKECDRWLDAKILELPAGSALTVDDLSKQDFQALSEFSKVAALSVEERKKCFLDEASKNPFGTSASNLLVALLGGESVDTRKDKHMDPIGWLETQLAVSKGDLPKHFPDIFPKALAVDLTKLDEFLKQCQQHQAELDVSFQKLMNRPPEPQLTLQEAKALFKATQRDSRDGINIPISRIEEAINSNDVSRKLGSLGKVDETGTFVNLRIRDLKSYIDELEPRQSARINFDNYKQLERKRADEQLLQGERGKLFSPKTLERILGKDWKGMLGDFAEDYSMPDGNTLVNVDMGGLLQHVRDSEKEERRQQRSRR